MSDQPKPRAVLRPIHERNARLIATGPRTPDGKAISSMNALKHGLTSKKVMLPGESQEEFDQLHDNLVDEHQPVGTLEFQLVSEIAACFWRLYRARAYENHALDGNAGGLFLGGSGGSASGFDRLLRYMGSIERQLNRTINQLRQLQADRRKLDRVTAAPQHYRTMAAAHSQQVTSTSDQFVSSDDNTTAPQHYNTTTLEHHNTALDHDSTRPEAA